MADMGWKSGGVGAIFKDEDKGILCAGADHRRGTVCRLCPTISMQRWCEKKDTVICDTKTSALSIS
jgi:hypothetical protein